MYFYIFEAIIRDELSQEELNKIKEDLMKEIITYNKEGSTRYGKCI